MNYNIEISINIQEIEEIEEIIEELHLELPKVCEHCQKEAHEYENEYEKAIRIINELKSQQ